MIYPPVQIIGLAVLIATMVLFVYWVKANPAYWLWMVPLMAWLVHGVVFYCATIYYSSLDLVVPNILFFTDWSSIVRLQGYLAMLMYGVALIIHYPGERHGRRDNQVTE